MVVSAFCIPFVRTVAVESSKSKSVELCGEEEWLDWSAGWCAGVVYLCLGGKRVLHWFVVNVGEDVVVWGGERVAGEVL